MVCYMLFKFSRLKACWCCSPVPEISWRKTTGDPFPNKVKLRNSNAILEVPRFQQEDAGMYECVAENSRGKNAVRGRLSFHGRSLCWASHVHQWWIHRLDLSQLVKHRDHLCGIKVALQTWSSWIMHHSWLWTSTWRQWKTTAQKKSFECLTNMIFLASFASVVSFIFMWTVTVVYLLWVCLIGNKRCALHTNTWRQ